MKQTMKDKYKPAIIGIVFGVLLLLPLLASTANLGTVNVRSGIDGGAIEASGTSSRFYHGNITTTGGISIGCNNTYVDRLSRNVGFNVNATTMLQAGGWDTALWGTTIYRCDILITYPNGTSSFLLSKTEILSTFQITWRTNFSIPIGVYKVRANIWNISASYTGGFNYTPSTLTNVTVYNLLPIGSIVMLNATAESTIYRNQSLAFWISIFDAETPFPALVWNASLFKYKNATALYPTPVKTWYPYDTLNQTYRFSGSNVTGNYVFRMYIADTSGGVSYQTSSPLRVLNSPPVINSVHFNHTANLKRAVETMHFEVNVTDPDSNKSLTEVRVIIEYVPAIVYPGVIYYNYTSDPFTYIRTTGNFTGNVTVPAAFPNGTANIIVIAEDSDPFPAVTRFSPPGQSSFTVVNNIPVLHGITINGESLADGLRFSVYNNLDFAVNVSDIENRIDYVEVVLDGPPGSANISYFILGPAPYVVRIPASGLAPGSWGVFIIVSDTEGGLLVAACSGIIEVDPDLRDMTAYIIGGVLLAIVGFVIGGMVIWRYANARISSMRRDMIIKAKSKDVPDAKKGKPGEKGATTKYVEPPAKAEAEPKPPTKTAEKPETKSPAKAAEKPAGSKPFVGAQAPSAKGKPFTSEKKPDASKTKSK